MRNRPMTNRTTPETALIFPSDLTALEVRELSNSIATRALATMKTLAESGADLEEAFTLEHKDVMDVLWALEGSLDQLRQLSEIAQ